MEVQNKPQFEKDNDTGLVFNSNIKGLLTEIAKWGKFVGMVGFAMCGILLLVAVAIMVFGKQIGAQLEAVGQPASVAKSINGIVYAVIAVLYFFPAKHIYNFSVYMKQALEHDDQESIDYSFDRLRAFFKFIGMVALVAIGFYGIAFIAALLSGGAA